MTDEENKLVERLLNESRRDEWINPVEFRMVTSIIRRLEAEIVNLKTTISGKTFYCEGCAGEVEKLKAEIKQLEATGAHYFNSSDAWRIGLRKAETTWRQFWDRVDKQEAWDGRRGLSTITVDALRRWKFELEPRDEVSPCKS